MKEYFLSRNSRVSQLKGSHAIITPAARNPKRDDNFQEGDRGLLVGGREELIFKHGRGPLLADGGQDKNPKTLQHRKYVNTKRGDHCKQEEGRGESRY